MLFEKHVRKPMPDHDFVSVCHLFGFSALEIMPFRVSVFGYCFAVASS